jgi:cyanophycin synthetase
MVGINGSGNTGRLARLIAWLLHISGKHVGLACSEGLFLDSRQVDGRNCVHWEAGQRLLMNRSIQAAVFENSNRMILAEGLAYDKCTVGVVTDIHWHADLAEFDILDAEQTYKVARTQIDVVLPSGTAVLNADAPQVPELADLCDGRVIFYAMTADHPVLQSHRAAGERVVFLNQEHMVLAHGPNDMAKLPLSSLKKAKASQPQMVMAAIAAAWACNVSIELIAAGLRTFESTPHKTPY